MKYLIFDTFEEAEIRNEKTTISLSGFKPSNLSKYWFSMISKDDQFALIIDDENLVNESERENLKDEDWMKDNGWTI